MGIAKEYRSLLKTFNRTLAQLSRLYGVESDYEPVKNPSRASIKRLAKELEKVRTRGWIAKREMKRGGPVVGEPSVEEAYPPMLVDVIIDNFRKLITDMAEDGYQLQYSHSFSGSTKRTADGYSKKMWSAEQLVGFGATIGGALQEAIDLKGKESVAIAIQENGEQLQQIAEDLIFAIYDRNYAMWGGGRDEYEAVLNFEFKALLLSGPDILEA